MSPTTPTSSSLLFSLLALGFLTGSSVSASPALQERQFGTGTGTGGGSVGCAALVASGNYSQSLLALPSFLFLRSICFVLSSQLDLYRLSLSY